MGNLTHAFPVTWLLASLLLFGCGSKIDAAKNPPVQREQDLGSQPLKGNLLTTSGFILDLVDDAAIPQILFFASETCSICRHETQGLVALFHDHGLPTNVKIYTALVGSNIADAKAWQNEIGASWIVASDLAGGLFRQYCPELQTPCVLIRHPIRGTKKLIGEHSIEDFERHTGTWSYL